MCVRRKVLFTVCLLNMNLQFRMGPLGGNVTPQRQRGKRCHQPKVSELQVIYSHIRGGVGGGIHIDQRRLMKIIGVSVF